MIWLVVLYGSISMKKTGVKPQTSVVESQYSYPLHRLLLDKLHKFKLISAGNFPSCSDRSFLFIGEQG